MKAAIEIRGLGKRYHLTANQRYLSLRDTLMEGMKQVFSAKTSKEEFWALKDIDLTINPGDKLGIIGRNGAGKSTLLKILSRVTAPSAGQFTIRGRLASLLEVGTGFHPELTGRENIYFNGSILGLKKKEIDRQFDAIVDFSSVSAFLDLPLKNFSSGMQLRLAFAVAAHLEPEILIIDEVLAVGDLEFQQKCLGKMEQVSREHGRTIVFVSHSLKAIKDLCTSALWLDHGKIFKQGETTGIIAGYIQSFSKHDETSSRVNAGAHLPLFIEKIKIINEAKEKQYQFNQFDKIGVIVSIRNNNWNKSFTIGFALNTAYNGRVLIDIAHVEALSNGTTDFLLWIPSHDLTPNNFSVDISLMNNNHVLDIVTNFTAFEISIAATKYEGLGYDYGIIEKKLTWQQIA